MYPIIALIILMLFTWIVAIWASCADSAAPDDGEKPEKRSDEQDHREASLKQDIERSTASPRLQQNPPMHRVREDLPPRIRVPNPQWRTLWLVNGAVE